MPGTVALTPHRRYGALGGQLARALATGDTATADRLRRELAVARASDAIVKHVGAIRLSPTEIGQLIAAINAAHTATPAPGADPTRPTETE